MSELNKYQQEHLTKAEKLTKAQLHTAVKIVNETLHNDQRGLDPAVLAGVLAALSANYALYINDKNS